MRMLAAMTLLIGKVVRRLHMLWLMPLFRSHGRSFRFDPRGVYTYGTISVGDNVNLGMGATMIAALSEIMIGSNVIFGPEVMVIGGGHNMETVGLPMASVHEKRPGDDLGVVFEDDIWVGARAIILRGVTVGRGSVIGAGAVVTSDVPRYAIVVGCPARVLRFRWPIETILEHEAKLYPPEARTPRERLEADRARSAPAVK